MGPGRPRTTLRRPGPAGRGSPRGVSIVNTDHPDFVAPGNMPARIRAYCARTGQRVPAEDTAPSVRCILDSLALGYRCAIDDLWRW